MINLPVKKYTLKQDVQLGKEAASEVRKQYPIIEDQHSRSASIRRNKTATWFQIALLWSTILKSLILNG